MKHRHPDTLSVPPDGRPEEEQPRWRRDFPIDWPQDRYISQRDFIKFLMLTSLAFVTGQFWLVARNALKPARSAPPPMRIAGADDLPVGGSFVFHYPDDRTPCILVRTGASTFVAYAQQCTHLLCPVIPRPEEGHFHCPCHEGLFDMETGQPLAGPPRRPLARVHLEVKDGAVFATRMEVRA